MRIVASIVFALIAAVASGQDNGPVMPVGKGVTLPRVRRKVDPEYSKEANRQRIQGTVVYSLIVGTDGKPHDIQVISPIGYGLDEKGLESLEKWEFVPGMKDGMPVRVRAQVEVNFRFRGLPFDTKQEERRTSYNTAMHNLQTDKKQNGIETVERLAGEKYPPAMSLYGDWQIQGMDVPKDVPAGLALIRKAADLYDGHALFVLGTLMFDGQLMPADPEKGIKLIRDAATYGSQAAQLFLGLHYEDGSGGLPNNPERARYYFRLCAARGIPACEFHVGKLLMLSSGKQKGDAAEALAWLELAADKSAPGAAPLARQLRDTMPPEETQQAEKLKLHLVRQ